MEAKHNMHIGTMLDSSFFGFFDWAQLACSYASKSPRQHEFGCLYSYQVPCFAVC